jgi:hypothetical protein
VSAARPRSRPAWPCHVGVAILVAFASGCDGVVWELDDTVDAAAPFDGATPNDNERGDGAMSFPPDSFTVAPGAPWPFCVNGQCSEPWLHCETNANATNAGLCVPCIHNGSNNNNAMQCPEDATESRLGVCDLMPGDPFENQCVECLDQHDCGDNEVCNAYQCVSVCLNGISCPKSSANTCDRTRSICIACSKADDCPSGESCNIDTGRCGDCASDGDCHQPSQPKCDVRDNACVECRTSADCNGAVCDPQTQMCVDSKM